eukprot:SAG11_NODE_462_length_9229_cov_18.235926_4_plen_182_part_00
MVTLTVLFLVPLPWNLKRDCCCLLLHTHWAAVSFMSGHAENNVSLRGGLLRNCSLLSFRGNGAFSSDLLLDQDVQLLLLHDFLLSDGLDPTSLISFREPCLLSLCFLGEGCFRLARAQLSDGASFHLYGRARFALLARRFELAHNQGIAQPRASAPQRASSSRPFDVWLPALPLVLGCCCS